MNAIPACQRAAFQSDPLAGYLDVWVLCEQMLQYFERGEGRDLFGEWQPIAVGAARQLVEEIKRDLRYAADVDEDMGEASINAGLAHRLLDLLGDVVGAAPQGLHGEDVLLAHADIVPCPRRQTNHGL